ncbi:unnamed protein product [Heligmosomoides polygyrus]|uniref:DUF1963 domain-containing protein n=1 Tax=Heligmosomoides polygyrus TaxID=6339 RepID=A0A183FXY7_HELPZ|nr:unnamed protein product [Heligmosomoides polygyrus]
MLLRIADVALPRLIHCDGPCSTWAPEDYIVQFGLCDHNICFRCYENEESIALTDDGTPCFFYVFAEGEFVAAE